MLLRRGAQFAPVAVNKSMRRAIAARSALALKLSDPLAPNGRVLFLHGKFRARTSSSSSLQCRGLRVSQPSDCKRACQQAAKRAAPTTSTPSATIVVACWRHNYCPAQGQRVQLQRCIMSCNAQQGGRIHLGLDVCKTQPWRTIY